MQDHVPVHVGYRPPSSANEAEADESPPSGRELDWVKVRVSALDRVSVGWERHEMDPRWVGYETASWETTISGFPLPARTQVTLAVDLAPAERDLGQRLLNDRVDAP